VNRWSDGADATSLPPLLGELGVRAVRPGSWGDSLQQSWRGTHGVLILAGPTAAGKTELALELAERFDAEIVGADSRQIYRDMPIGTAAPTAEQRARVPHHLIGFLDPHERYSAARYAADALAAIHDIVTRGKRALVVGGTGFYVRALCGDVALSSAYDPLLRSRLAREARMHPPDVLHAWLASLDPKRADTLPPSDRYRVVRALEIALAPPAEVTAEAPRSLRAAGIASRKAFLDLDDDELDRRIERRTDAMLAAGLVAEAERVGTHAVAADAVGYPHALAYARGWCSAGELRSLLIRATRRYARRQRTWFRSETGVVHVPARDATASIARLAREIPGWA
jgi:tRNA dimethylallyltransferase